MPKLSNRWSAVAGSVAVVVGLLAMASCGSDDTVDASKAEQGIESSSLSTSTTQITSASCPNDVKKEKDKTFTCDVKLSGGGKAKVTVSQTSNHNTFSYSFKQGSVQLPGATVNCPQTVTVAVGKTFTCPFTTSAGRQGQVSFTFSSASGTVDSSSVKES